MLAGDRWNVSLSRVASNVTVESFSRCTTHAEPATEQSEPATGLNVPSAGTGSTRYSAGASTTEAEPVAPVDTLVAPPPGATT
jgi:hypothetical protein